MSREATQELGGWRSPAVIEKVYQLARSEEVGPEMRKALRKAIDRLEVDCFTQELEESVTLANDGEVGLTRSVSPRQRHLRGSPICRGRTLPPYRAPIFWASLVVGAGIDDVAAGFQVQGCVVGHGERARCSTLLHGRLNFGCRSKFWGGVKTARAVLRVTLRVPMAGSLGL